MCYIFAEKNNCSAPKEGFLAFQESIAFRQFSELQNFLCGYVLEASVLPISFLLGFWVLLLLGFRV
jgi:hypothetical protein